MNIHCKSFAKHLARGTFITAAIPPSHSLLLPSVSLVIRIRVAFLIFLGVNFLIFDLHIFHLHLQDLLAGGQLIQFISIFIAQLALQTFVPVLVFESHGQCQGKRKGKW